MTWSSFIMESISTNVELLITEPLKQHVINLFFIRIYFKKHYSLYN